GGHVELLGVLDRHPHQLNELGVGTDYVLDAMRDGARVHGEEARVEAAWSSGRRDGAADEMDGGEVRQHAVARKGLPGASRNVRGLRACAKEKPGFLARLPDRGERERAGAHRACFGKALHEARLLLLVELARDR